MQLTFIWPPWCLLLMLRWAKTLHVHDVMVHCTAGGSGVRAMKETGQQSRMVKDELIWTWAYVCHSGGDKSMLETGVLTRDYEATEPRETTVARCGEAHRGWSIHWAPRSSCQQTTMRHRTVQRQVGEAFPWTALVRHDGLDRASSRWCKTRRWRWQRLDMS
jgi:hypothetical protein